MEYFLNEITKHGVIIKNGKKVYANKFAIELLGVKKRTLLHDLNKIVEIRDFFESDKSVFKQQLPLKSQISTKYVKFYIKKLPEGFILIADDYTKTEREKEILSLIVKMNELISKSKTKESLFDNFRKIATKAGFKVFDIKKQNTYDSPFIDKAFDEIVYNDDTRLNPSLGDFKDVLLKNGCLSSVALPVRNEDGTERVLVICKDEIDYFRGFRKLAEVIQRYLSKDLKILEKLNFNNILLNAINRGHEWVVITDKNGNIVFANDAVEKITGYKKEELIGKNPRIFKSSLHDKTFYKKLWDTILKGDIFESVIINKKKDGSLFYLLDKIVKVDDFFISLGKDITNEKKYFHLIEELKFKDPITGLCNKDGFFEQANEYLKKFAFESHILLVVDIYNFNAINHKYGISTGDNVLKIIGERLKNAFFQRDLIYKLNEIALGRFNGDEFAIFLEKASEESMPKILNKLYEVFSKECKIDSESIKLEYNGGISIFPKDAKSIEEMLNHASIALVNAKKEGSNIVKLYSKEYSEEIDTFNKKLSLVKNALRNNEFQLFYQPIVDVSSEKIVSAEGLLRIVTPKRVITPGEFISILENSNYSIDVASKMLEDVDDVLSKTSIKISYNLCEKQFKNPKIIKRLQQIGQKHKDRFQIELIERVLINEKEYALRVLEKLKDATIKIAIDDFGTGYSSLSYIRELPVDVLKIDISFIRKMMTNPKDLAIVKTIINLGKELEIKTVAEGVESKEQVAILKAFGCDYIQGFFFYKPMPKKELLNKTLVIDN